MKNLLKSILLWCIVAAPSVHLTAQAGLDPQSHIESLLVKLPKLQDDSLKMALLLDLSNSYRNIDPAVGVKYAQQGLDLAKKLALKRGTAKMFQSLGTNYLLLANYTNALDCFFKSLKISEEMGNKQDMVAALANIGAVYDYQREFTKAIEYYFKAIEIMGETGDKQRMATLLANIGAAYSGQPDKDFVAQGLDPADRFKQAQEYYFKSLKMFEELGDKNGMALNYGNIADAYTQQKKYLQSIEYAHKALMLSEETNNKFSQAYNLGNISDAYLNMAKEEDFERAFGGQSIELQHGKRQLITKPFVFEQANIYLKKAMEIDQEIGELNELQKNYRCLSELEAMKGNYKLALDYFQLHTATKDSVYSEENKEEIEALEKARAADLKEMSERLASMQLETSKKEGRYYIAGLALLTLLVFLGIRNISIRNQAKKASLFKRAFGRLRQLSTNEDDVADLVIRKMSIVIIACSTCLAGAIWACMYYVYYGLCIPFYGPVLYFAIVAPSIAMFFYHKRESFLVNIQLFCIFFIPTMMEWTSGGFQHGIVVTWAFLAPIGALIFKDILHAVIWMVLFLAVIAITILLNDFFAIYQLPISAQGEAVFFGMNIIGPSLVIFFSMRYFVATIFKVKQTIQDSNLSLTVALDDLGKEKMKTEDLLLNILPKDVAEELKEKGSAEAQYYEEVTVFFSDFKGFTSLSEKLTPAELVAEIDHCFSAFDRITSKYQIEKIKTIGDSYMAVGGLNKENNQAQSVVQAALEMQAFMTAYAYDRNKQGQVAFEMRVGVHTGPVVAGIVGTKKFQYDIWGDTVNMASRMESSGEVGKVNISGTTYNSVWQHFDCQHRGKVMAKNKGEIDMYFVASL